MYIKDAFEEVFTGFNMNNATSSEKSADDAYFIQKDSIQYTNIIEKRLIKKKITTDINNKLTSKTILVFPKGKLNTVIIATRRPSPAISTVFTVTSILTPIAQENDPMQINNILPK